MTCANRSASRSLPRRYRTRDHLPSYDVLSVHTRQILSLKEASAGTMSDLESKLREASERHAAAIQAAKADAAAEVAELHQRHDGVST